MKKLFVSGLALFIAVSFVTSQTPGQYGKGGAKANRGMMSGGMMMNADSTGMCSMMGTGMMMPRQIVPVDGGIIVIMGNKLIKFDNNLEKEKEVALILDEKSMRQIVDQMRQTRLMMQEMMQSPVPQQKESK